MLLHRWVGETGQRKTVKEERLTATTCMNPVRMRQTRVGLMRSRSFRCTGSAAFCFLRKKDTTRNDDALSLKIGAQHRMLLPKYIFCGFLPGISSCIDGNSLIGSGENDAVCLP